MTIITYVIIWSKYHSNMLPNNHHKLVEELQLICNPRNLHIKAHHWEESCCCFVLPPMICSNCETKKYVWCLPSYHIIRHLTTQYLHNYIYQIWCMYSLFVVRFLFCIKNSYKNIVTEVYYFLLLSNRACECMYLCILNSDCHIIDYDM